MITMILIFLFFTVVQGNKYIFLGSTKCEFGYITLQLSYSPLDNSSSISFHTFSYNKECPRNVTYRDYIDRRCGKLSRDIHESFNSTLSSMVYQDNLCFYSRNEVPRKSLTLKATCTGYELGADIMIFIFFLLAVLLLALKSPLAIPVFLWFLYFAITLRKAETNSILP